jgi:L-threonylcarbamoyladenylate synthase
MVDFEIDIQSCIKVLTSGGTILYPTDTVWGIGCDALQAAAVDKISAIKHRPTEKSYIVLVAEPRDVLKYVAAPHPDFIDIIDSFTAPTTVVYPGAIDLPDNLVNTDGSIAIRVCDDPFCKALIKRYKKPIVSTSANLSGEPTAYLFNQINPEILNNVDYTVIHRQDDYTARNPSRIVSINEDGTLEILRP